MQRGDRFTMLWTGINPVLSLNLADVPMVDHFCTLEVSDDMPEVAHIHTQILFNPYNSLTCIYEMRRVLQKRKTGI